MTSSSDRREEQTEIIITAQNAGKRLDAVLAAETEGLSRSFLQNAFSRLERYADHGDADESFFMSMEQLIQHIGDRMIRRAFELQMEKVRNRD